MPKRSPTHAALFSLASVAGYALRFVPASPGAAAILPPGPMGSLGDEAMVSVVLDRLRGRGMSVRIVNMAPEDAWAAVFDGVTCIGPVWNARLPIAMRLRRCVGTLLGMLRSEEIWCIGADVMDGNYDRAGTLRLFLLLTVLSCAGRSVTVTGFSWNAHPAQSSVAGIRSIMARASLFCRDPISHERLRSDGLRARLAADLAFLLEPAAAPDVGRGVEELLAGAKERSATVVGVCPHFTHENDAELDEKIAATATTINLLLRRDPTAVAIVLAHDTRSRRGISHAEVVRRIAERASEDVKPRIAVCPIRDGMAADIRSLCASFSFAISGSMHFTISCLSRGIPTVSLTYQDKFEGLFAHFGLRAGDCSVPQRDMARERLTELAVGLLDPARRETFGRTIESALPTVVRLSESHFRTATV